jgi:hypothetical protein
MQPSMITERTRGTSRTRRDGSSANTHSNSKGAPKSRKRKSQETIDEGGEGDPETQKERAPPAAAGSTNDGTLSPKRANGSTIEQADRRSGKRRRSSRKANSSSDLVQVMMAELMECTQTDIPGEIFAYQAMFPEHEHDHIDPFLA